jgi:hypothetical protein
MLQRTYVIELREDANPEAVQALIDVLEAAPRHIPRRRRRSSDTRRPTRRGPRGTSVRAPHRAKEPLVMLERVELRRGREDEYLRRLRTDHVPRAAERGLILSGCWSAADELATLWTFEGGWSGWDRIRNAFVVDPWTRTWLESIEPLRCGGRRRLMAPAADADQ